MKSKQIAVIIVALVLVGNAGFFTGVKYQQSKQPSRTNFQSFGQQRGFSATRQPAGSQVVRGEIIDKDEESITVKLPDDSSKIVLLSESTTINKATEGSVDDLKSGDQVMVFGQTNSDGSVSAAQIQLNSGLGRGFDRLREEDKEQPF